MVLQEKKKLVPVGNGHYVLGAISNIDSPTFSRNVNNDKTFSKSSTSLHRVGLAVIPFTNSSISFVKDGSKIFDNIIKISEKKKVKFMVDPCDSQKVRCWKYAAATQLTNSEVTNRWYTSHENKRMRNERNDEALEARTMALTYLKEFQQLHTLCEDNALDRESIWSPLAHKIAASQYRGMECTIFNETLRVSQSTIVLEVLGIQDVFRDLLSPDELMHELQSQSTKLTECSTRLARMIGIGDAIEVCQVAKPQEQRRDKQAKKKIIRTYEANNVIAGNSILYEI